MAEQLWTRGATAVAVPDVTYAIDRGDHLVQVNDAWSAFALANGAPHLVAEHVIGRSIWEFIGDETTRLLYRQVIGPRARGRPQPVSLPL